jgi:MoaA/NifB/PqqE/SkfB family radical SAM enzyme
MVTQKNLPRLPLDGIIDLTYRCNNTCRHCWLWLPSNAPQKKEELTLAEIRRIVDEARQMGCQAWAISGGEPMLRPDFNEIFDYITRKSVSYSLNTNGTLITPEIARLLTRKGRKMVALYGATADVHDRVTRNPGSYEATMRGFAYLKEAGAGFTVQIIPMRENYHQYADMLNLAESLSPDYRVGASWLLLSACGSPTRNREITNQRLDPTEVILLDEPDPARELLTRFDDTKSSLESDTSCLVQGDDRLFAACIAKRRDFHIDPYGGMSFCYYIKHPALRFNLRRESFHRVWDDLIPALAQSERGDTEYLENCGSCTLRRDCKWCGVFGYLEHRRLSAKVDYLCKVASQTRQFKEDWKLNHLHYYNIAGITIEVAASFPITDNTFDIKFRSFRADGPGEDTISIRLESSIPLKGDLRLGKEVYHKAPWAIYKQPNSWVYLGISAIAGDHDPVNVAIFNENHSQGRIYRSKETYERGGLESLTTFPSDQLLIARVLADRQGCYLHAAGISMNGKGLMFVGHSEAGKSTMLKMLRGSGEILCDDRIILRRWPEGFQIHGTWSHGELPDVSPIGAPLQAILFLEKASTNEAIPITDKMTRLGEVLSYIIRPMVDADWWEKTLTLAEGIADEVPAYRLRFDKSGQVLEVLQKLL